MKKQMFFILCISFILLFMSACNMGTDQSMEDRQREDVTNQLDPNRNFDHSPNQDVNHNLGYVRYSKNEIDMQDQNQKEAKIDRSQMADMITRLILTSDGFEEVATLITDKEVFIAYDKGGNRDSDEAKQIARKTAESVMPRFYEIYVTDNKSYMYDIQSLHNSGTNRDYDNLIQKFIDEMD